ncbi:hypothetical protein T190115A13A_140087 [Tenacibaculum sp. 190524A02b]|uniref:Uncharacterized protein n=1 Tax=Tenacibaculum vairaonense TaxID=3137860 RepID=A0ABP1F4H2_9FLAO
MSILLLLGTTVVLIVVLNYLYSWLVKRFGTYKYFKIMAFTLLFVLFTIGIFLLPFLFLNTLFYIL